MNQNESRVRDGKRESGVDGDIMARMRGEEADLSRKLKAVRDFLAAYGAPPSNEPAPIPELLARPTQTAREKVGIDGYSAYGRTIVATAMTQMLVAPGPVKTRQIVEYLQGVGFEITGQDAVNAVGALLYRSADLVSHGKAGWTLADEEVAANIIDQYALNENEASAADAANASDTAAQAQHGGPQE